MELKQMVWDALTQDAELAEKMGGTVRLYDVKAEPNAPFPYLVQRAAYRSLDPYALVEAELNVDIFDHRDTTQAIQEISRRATQILDRKYEDGFRFFLDYGLEVMEETRYVLHMNLTFTVRHIQEWRIKDAAGI